MRHPRFGILGLLVAVLLLGLTMTTSSSATASPTTAGRTSVAASHGTVSHDARVTKKKHRKHKKAGKGRPEGFTRRSVRAIRGTNKITVVWPARRKATAYTVIWTPLIDKLPDTPAGCTSPCKRRSTHSTSMVLTAADMTTYGRRISSSSGNTVRLRVFALNGKAMSHTNNYYPNDSWVAPAANANTDWLRDISSQLPLPLPAKAGRSVAISSFNVLAASSTGVPSWSTRAPRVAAQINGLGSSIVATQENSNSSTGVASGASQFQDLASRLRSSGWALADGRDWDAASGLSRSWSSQATRIYYKTAAWDQLDNGALMTHAPISGQTYGVNVDRWVSWTKLRSTASPSTQVCVIDAHLLTNLGHYDAASANHRNVEMGQILSQLDNPNSSVRHVGTRVGQACAGIPTTFAGDLNSAQHSPFGNQPQATMLGKGFVDTANATHRYYTRFAGAGTIGAWHPNYGTQIDYVLTKGMGGAKSFKVNAITPGRAGSDHYPITAVVNVPAS